MNRDDCDRWRVTADIFICAKVEERAQPESTIRSRGDNHEVHRDNSGNSRLSQASVRYGEEQICKSRSHSSVQAEKGMPITDVQPWTNPSNGQAGFISAFEDGWISWTAADGPIVKMHPPFTGAAVVTSHPGLRTTRARLRNIDRTKHDSQEDRTMPNQNPPRPSPFHKGAMGALTHDRQISDVVLATYIQNDDNVSASITAGSPYFKDLYVAAYNLVLLEVDPEFPVLHGHTNLYWDREIAASSDGTTPIPAKTGQYVVVGATAQVPEHALAPGVFTGTVVLKGNTFSETVALAGTYLAVDENSQIGRKWLQIGGESRTGEVRANAHADPNGGGTLQEFANGVLYEVPGIGVYFLSPAVYAKWNSKTGTGEPVRAVVGLPTGDTIQRPGQGEASQFTTGAIMVPANRQACAVYGDIYGDYSHLGSLTNPSRPLLLGFPLSDEEANASGRFQRFDLGEIFWTSATGAHEIHGDIRQEWYHLNGAGSAGFLGFPISDETGTPDGIGRFNRFQAGMIYWAPATGAHGIHGAILDRWSALGFERSYLGYPISDEQDWTNPANGARGRVSAFEHGNIGWTPLDGVIELPETRTDHQNVETPAGTALGGWVDIVLRSDGSYVISYHLHDSGVTGYDFTVRAIFAASNGMTFVGQHSGHVGGTLTSGSRDDDFTEPGFSEAIRHNWAAVKGGRLWVTKDYSTTGVVGFIEDVAKAVVDVVAGAVGAAVGVIISLGREIGPVFDGLGLGGTFGLIAGVVVFAAGGGLLMAVASGVAVGAVTNALIQQRPLSPEEAQFASQVFGNSLPPADQIILTNLSGLGGRAFTMPGIDGKTYVNLGDAYDEPNPLGYVNTAYLTPGQVLIHELTHVWQGTHASFLPGFVCDGIVNQTHNTLGQNVYEYGPPGRVWSAFNLEQQGAIVDQWFGGDRPEGVDRPASLTKMDQDDPYFSYIRDNIRMGRA